MNNQETHSMQDEGSDEHIVVDQDMMNHHSSSDSAEKPKPFFFDDLFGVPVWALAGVVGLIGVGIAFLTSGGGSGKPDQVSTASLPAITAPSANAVEPVSHVVRTDSQPQVMQEPTILGGVAGSESKPAVATTAIYTGSAEVTDKSSKPVTTVTSQESEDKIMAAIDKVSKRQDGLEASMLNATKELADIQLQLAKMNELLTPKKTVAPTRKAVTAKHEIRADALSHWALNSAVEGSEAMITNAQGESHVVAIGDEIDGAKVLRIYMNKVVTSRGDIFAR